MRAFVYVLEMDANRKSSQFKYFLAFSFKRYSMPSLTESMWIKYVCQLKVRIFLDMDNTYPMFGLN